MFVKAKGRDDPETGMEAVRFLTDLRALNNALEWPAHWVQNTPTIESARNDVPAWAAWFSSEDVKDAFEGMVIAEGSRHYLTVAPPVPLGPGDISKEELREWGYT
jgi:hypothetical protein